MFFDGWEKQPKKEISPALLWEYDLSSKDWDWQKMRKIVVSRVIERGRRDDYYAMFQIYGGVRKVREIVREIPLREKRDMNWCCVLFGLKMEDLCSYRKMLLRKRLMNS